MDKIERIAMNICAGDGNKKMLTKNEYKNKINKNYLDWKSFQNQTFKSVVNQFGKNININWADLSSMKFGEAMNFLNSLSKNNEDSEKNEVENKK